MAGKQAKVLTRPQVRAALHRARRGRYPERDRIMILLSVKAGLRAGEIAKLRWSMVLDADGRLGHRIQLNDIAAKKRSGRTTPCTVRLTKCCSWRHSPAAGREQGACAVERSRDCDACNKISWLGADVENQIRQRERIAKRQANGTLDRHPIGALTQFWCREVQAGPITRA
jgi:hypothetical protein